MLKLLSSTGCCIQSLMKNVAANVALPDVTYQDRFQRDRLKMPESVGGSTERQRWAQDEITMRRPHFPHLLLGVIKQQKKKKKVRFWLSSISFLYEMGWKVQERLQDKQHQGRKCSCRQLTGLVPSLWLIQQDKVQTVCTQFWQPN